LAAKEIGKPLPDDLDELEHVDADEPIGDVPSTVQSRDVSTEVAEARS